MPKKWRAWNYRYLILLHELDQNETILSPFNSLLVQDRIEYFKERHQSDDLRAYALTRHRWKVERLSQASFRFPPSDSSKRHVYMFATDSISLPVVPEGNSVDAFFLSNSIPKELTRKQHQHHLQHPAKIRAALGGVLYRQYVPQQQMRQQWRKPGGNVANIIR